MNFKKAMQRKPKKIQIQTKTTKKRKDWMLKLV